jgi:hypothetical protein
VRLVDLEPKWLIPGKLFVFKCPHCHDTPRNVRLSCTVVAMKAEEQDEAFDREFGEDNRHVIVGCKFLAWTMTNGPSLETMSITPSLDASASGHWHGFITNGAIT